MGNPVPGYINFNNKTGHPTISGSCCKLWFDPPCYDPTPLPDHEALTEGICTGEWMTNITLYDQLRVPEHLGLASTFSVSAGIAKPPGRSGSPAQMSPLQLRPTSSSDAYACARVLSVFHFLGL